MIFVHTSDINIGFHPDTGNLMTPKERALELKNVIKRIVALSSEKKADLLFISGNLFHSSPSKSELMDINSELEKFTGHVCIVTGSQDYLRECSNFNEFDSWSRNITFFKEGAVRVKHFPELNVDVYGISYRNSPDHPTPIGNIAPKNKKACNILVAFGGEGNRLPMNFKELHSNGFDYLALGGKLDHMPIDNYGAYPGSPEPLSANATNQHGIYIGEINTDGESPEKGKVKLTFIPFAQRKYIDHVCDIDPIMSWPQIINRIKNEITGPGKTGNFYNVKLVGCLNRNIDFNQEDILSIPGVITVKNDTSLDFDIDKLYEENKSNIIGQFIEKVRSEKLGEALEKKTLENGLKALYHVDN